MDSFCDAFQFPVVRDDKEFWDGIEEYARQLKEKEEARLKKRSAPSLSTPPSKYCHICLKYKYAKQVEDELLLHLAQEPTHLVQMVFQDEQCNPTYTFRF
jgi:hypothetical protein